MTRTLLALVAATGLLAACADSGPDAGAAGGAGSAGYGGAGGGYGAGGGAGSSALGGYGAGGTAGSGGAAAEELARLGDRIFFATDASTLATDATATLAKQAAWLQRNPQVSVRIAGNCDERGTEEYNLALGQRRASAARDYLVAQGIDAARIETISYGKDRPTALGSDPASWAQNRNAITELR